jgi:aminoglycoside phosphotransferase (APT) family kinase protein
VRATLAELVSGGLVASALAGRLIDVIAPAEGMPASAQAVVVHGDFHMRHLLLDDRRALAGVIDWGDVHRGDPAVDLQIAWSLLPPPARPAFFDAYGTVDARTLAVARVVAVVIACALLRSAADFALPRVAREASWALENISRD